MHAGKTGLNECVQNELSAMPHFAMTIYDLLEQWDLIEPGANLSAYSRTKIAEFARALDSLYREAPSQTSNSIILGAFDAQNIVESPGQMSRLGNPLLFSKRLILPDPLYSYLSTDAHKLWSRLPWSGSKAILKDTGPYCGWKNYWAPPISDRLHRLHEVFPTLQSNLLAIRPLVDRGYIALFPWERCTIPIADQLAMAAVAIEALPAIKSYYETVPQGEYATGIRVPPMAVAVAGEGLANLKPGTPMWFGNRTPIVLLGLIGAAMSSQLGAHVYPFRKGDSLIHNAILSGQAPPTTRSLAKECNLLDFSVLGWSDLVSLRCNDDVVNSIRETLAKAEEAESEDALLLVREELSESITKLNESASLTKIVENNFIAGSIGAFGGFISSLGTGTPTDISLLKGLIAGAATLVLGIMNGALRGEAPKARKSARILYDLLQKNHK